MTTFYAQPYDPSAEGFTFETAEEYQAKAAAIRNSIGQPVEEFEIQFIDGEDLDEALAQAWNLNQQKFAAFLEAVAEWDDLQKQRFIIAVGECGSAFDPEKDDPDDLDVDLCPAESLQEFAMTCVEDEWFGPVPDALIHYIDYEAVARDLAIEYSEITIAGERFVYRRL